MDEIPLSKRFTAECDRTVVVFFIGFTINKWWKAWQLFAVFLAGMRVARYLRRTPSGMLQSYPLLCWPNALGWMQYWNSFDELEHFARVDTAPHIATWREANARLARTDAVGIFHETYITTPSTRETIYLNMKPFGLSSATNPSRPKGVLDSSRERLSRAKQ